MQVLYKRLGVITGFLLLLFLLVANALLTRSQLEVQVSSQAGVEHTQQVLVALSQTQSLIEGAETGQRGYLYTSNIEYLDPYDYASAQISRQLDILSSLVSGSALEREEVAQLRTLTEAKLDEISRTVLLFQSGYPDAAHAEVISDHGRVLMIQISNLLGKIQLQETAVASVRADTAQHSIRRTYISIYLATFVGALGLSFLAYYIFSIMSLRDLHAVQLQEREEWFRYTLTSLGDAVIATDERGFVTFLNPMAEKLMGVTLAIARGKSVEAVFPIFNETTRLPVDNPVKQIVEHGTIVSLAHHTVLQHADGQTIPIEDSAAPIRDARGKLVGIVMVFRDATNERKSQEVLRKTEKLAAAARLAATVAHEINNPLEAIGNLIYIARTTDGIPDSARGHLSLAEQELDRVSHITRQTLGFYRESKNPDQVDLPSLVESILNIYSNKFHTKNITIEREFDDCPPINGLSGELTQAIANLISNAADAVPNGGLIRVDIDCREEPSSKDTEAASKDSPATQIVTIIIRDNGPGIAPENREHIFEPFFTTKKDVGTGLGLWVTKEIIERHSGTVEVHSIYDAEPTGTTFTVTLPVDPHLHAPAA
jgi:PAS domain S-box-containing protein